MRKIMVAVTCLVLMGSQRIVHAQETPQEPVQYDLAEAWDEFETIMQDVEWFAVASRRMAVHICEEHGVGDSPECWHGVHASIKEFACFGFGAHNDNADQESIYAGRLGMYFDAAVFYANDGRHPLRDVYALLVSELGLAWGCFPDDDDESVDQRPIRNAIMMSVFSGSA